MHERRQKESIATAENAPVMPRRTPASWKSSKPAFASRVLLALLLVSGGINNLLWRNPVFDPTPGGERFLRLLHETGYLLHAVALTEIAAGVLLLSGYFVPLALAVAAPLIVNFFLFHAFVQFAGTETVLIVGAFYSYLVYIHRDHFSGVLAP